jgi:hypothetical protein
MRIGEAINQYAVDNNNWYPVAGQADTDRPVQGFQGSKLNGQPAVEPDNDHLRNNMTASLWMLVKYGSIDRQAWVCPRTADTPESLDISFEDPLGQSWDFTHAGHLSYSTLNMYHVTARRWWNSDVPDDVVLAADDNNATGPGVHTDDGQSVEANSLNHDGQSQNMLFGDGHIEPTEDPRLADWEHPEQTFGNSKGDNIYAMTKSGADAPPTLGLADGDAATDSAVAAKDVVLIPLTGNNGVSLSGKAPPLGSPLSSDVVVWLAAATVLLLFAFLVVRAIRHERGKP